MNKPAHSLASMSRPVHNLKLDLSGPSYRMPVDEGAVQTGLASPVTLAPKSARPTGTNELPSDFPFAATYNSGSRPADIDLTISDIIPATSVDLSAGGSSDKPIELDLDDDLDVNAALEANAMSRLFGDNSGASAASQGASENIFPTNMVGADDSTAEHDLKDLKDADFFNHLEGDSNLFSGLEAGESKPDVSQAENLSVLENFNADAGSAEHPPNIADQNFSFDGIDLPGDTIDLTIDSNFPDVNFPADFSMGEPSVEPKESGNSNNS